MTSNEKFQGNYLQAFLRYRNMNKAQLKKIRDDSAFLMKEKTVNRYKVKVCSICEIERKTLKEVYGKTCGHMCGNKLYGLLSYLLFPSEDSLIDMQHAVRSKVDNGTYAEYTGDGTIESSDEEDEEQGEEDLSDFITPDDESEEFVSDGDYDYSSCSEEDSDYE